VILFLKIWLTWNIAITKMHLRLKGDKNRVNWFRLQYANETRMRTEHVTWSLSLFVTFP